MSASLWVAVVICALGTLLMRVVPFLLMQRRLGSDTGLNAMPQWLVILGPLMIAGVLGFHHSRQPQPDLVARHGHRTERDAAGMAAPALPGLASGGGGRGVWGGGSRTRPPGLDR